MSTQRYSRVWQAAILSAVSLVVPPLFAEEQPSGPPLSKQPPRLQALPKAAEAKPEEQSKKTPAIEPAAANKTVVSLPVTVKLALLGEPRLFPYPIEVTTEGQVVVLTGKVSSEAEATLALNIAMGVPGVTSVTNKLEIAKDTKQTLSRKQDEMIAAYIKERFDRSTTLKSAGFNVKSEDGVVQLSGKTRFQVIALEAAEAAQQVPGVRAVRTDGVRIEAGD